MDDSDNRSPERVLEDERIAAEAEANPSPPTDGPRYPVEHFLSSLPKPRDTVKGPQPMAYSGIVENGVIRLLDPKVKLKEHARIIVIATEYGVSSSAS